MQLVKRHWDGLAVFDKLALGQPMHRGKDGNTQRLFDLTWGCKARLQHLHCQCATDTEPKPGKQRYQ